MTLKVNIFNLIGFLSAICVSLPLYGSEKTLGIIGDSVATGAVAGGIDATVTSLFFGFVSRGVNLSGDIDKTVNYPENAFSTVVSTGLGIHPDRIFNVAINGRRVGTIAAQLDVLLKKSGRFPDYLMLSFTANNACHEDIFKQSADEFYQRYYESLWSGKNGDGGMRYLVSRAAGAEKKRIYLLASLNFNEVLVNRSILEHTVPLHFSDVQCYGFREGATELPHVHYLAVKLRQMCPAILNTDPLSQEPDQVRRRQHLKSIHSAMIRAQNDVVVRLQTEKPQNVSVKFISSPANLAFDARHVANDCFHLSNQGQGYLGMAVWQEVYEDLMGSR